MATNKELLEKKVKSIGFNMGGYDKNIDKVSKAELKNVIDSIFGDSTDVDVKVRGKLHVVEIAVCDDDIDFMILTQEEYIGRYGDERWDRD